MEDDHPDPAVPAADWPLSGAEALRDELLAAYGDPARGYHDLTHLTAVLTRLDDLAAHGVEFDDLAVRLAAWFHDAVYDGERDAEERSATWAELALAGVVDDDTVAEVTRLVRMTETHTPAADDANGCALSDADLGILAADPATYAAYVAGVRADYRHVADEDFVAGRTAVMSDLLDRERLFRTEHADRAWTEAARRNVRAELATYRSAEARTA